MSGASVSGSCTVCPQPMEPLHMLNRLVQQDQAIVPCFEIGSKNVGRTPMGDKFDTVHSESNKDNQWNVIFAFTKGALWQFNQS